MRYEKEAHFTIIPAGEDHLVPTFSPRPSTNGGPMSTKESAPWHKLMAGTGASLARTMTYTWAHSRSLFMGEIAVLRKYTSWERSTAGSTLKISRITHRGTKTAGLIFHIGIAAQPRRSGGGRVSHTVSQQCHHVPTSLEPFAFARRDKRVVRACQLSPVPNRVPCYNVTALAGVLLRQLTITPNIGLYSCSTSTAIVLLHHCLRRTPPAQGTFQPGENPPRTCTALQP
jgi:hypothetical protein